MPTNASTPWPRRTKKNDVEAKKKQPPSDTEVMTKKALVVLKTCDPEKCGAAVEAIMAGLMAVVAVLRVKFARFIALGVSIGETLRQVAVRHAAPPLKAVVPEEYHKWILPGLNYTCKVIAVSIAYLMQNILSALHSATRGGQMAAKGVVFYLKERGLLKGDGDMSGIIENAGCAIALFGFLWQVVILSLIHI